MLACTSLRTLKCTQIRPIEVESGVPPLRLRRGQQALPYAKTQAILMVMVALDPLPHFGLGLPTINTLVQ